MVHGAHVNTNQEFIAECCKMKMFVKVTFNINIYQNHYDK